ncbi:MAG: DUF6671 family protein [Pseudoxanthomonas sp.]
MQATSDHRYHDQAVALLTQHGKERIIAPVLDASLGCRVELIGGYDTDRLGTFTREIPRAGTQIDAARRKARMGMDISGWPLGVASEGAFGPDPFTGMFPWNVECLLWIDDIVGLEIVGMASGKANFAHLLTDDWTAVEVFARQWGFPGHGIAVRPESAEDARIRKGVGSWTELAASFSWASNQSTGGFVFIETDVRAHANPTRQHNIRMAAEDLASRLCSRCPACAAPGFWVVEQVRGLPCEDCGAPTEESRAEILGCVKCAHRTLRERAGRRFADPGRCDYCNP